MALLNNNKDVLPLSSIAELLTAKVRTLKMYEEKGLFPKKKELKKLYSINDVQIISFVPAYSRDVFVFRGRRSKR